MSSVCDAIVTIYSFDAPYSDVKPMYVTTREPESNGWDDLCDWLRHKRPYGWQLGLIDRCQVPKQDQGTVTMKIELFFHKLPHNLHTTPTDLQSWALNWMFWVGNEPCITIVDVPGRLVSSALSEMLWRASLTLFIISSVCDAIVNIYSFDALYSNLRHENPLGWLMGLFTRCQLHKEDWGTVTMKVELFVQNLPQFLHRSPTDLLSWFVNWLFWVKMEPCNTIGERTAINLSKLGVF
ncbi:hypothetical protein X801_00575 [Opisthorchis viverrini]|uniref:Uncharacterized protein n=1 Tax=Opisthorchis viverrini TaxID=6198 RepID=A0A1S8X9X4_OPIVI|nr:hypothetical protein X801_00575 [Opisthorchis viverrini]